MTEIRKITQMSWRRLLASPEGAEMEAAIREQTPTVVSAEPHNIIFNAGIAEGYRRCFDRIKEMSATPKKEFSDEELEN